MESSEVVGIVLESRKAGEVPDLRGADLCGVNLSGVDLCEADLRWADLRWADLSGADLRWADLRWADLSGVDLCEADLRWANLRGVENFYLLPVQDPRGYAHPHAVNTDDGWRIRAGCRFFSIAEARQHWGAEYAGERWIGDLYLHACEWLEKQIQEAPE